LSRPSGEGGPGPGRTSKPRPSRTSEPEALSTVLSALGGERPWAAGMALGRLAAKWEEVVGERLADECTPAALEAGVLVVRASSAAWAAQLKFLAEAVRDRANVALGSGVIRALRVVVGSL
jgi:predicted nucleic acid-binding Zn ribbon protein